MTTTALPKLTTNMLAFQRSLEITEAMMYGVAQDAMAAALATAESKGETLDAAAKDRLKSSWREPVLVVEKGVRGQSSHANANGKDLKPGASNPQVVDFAMLPVDTDTLIIEFSLTALPNALAPSATDSHVVADGLKRLAQAYAKADGFEDLAARYISNIANGRFAWRNRITASDAVVEISWIDEGNIRKDVAFAALDLDLGSVPSIEDMKEAMTAGEASDLDALIAEFARSLAGTRKNRSLELRITWVGRMQPCGEVYPSQEYTRDSDKEKDKVSRRLSAVDRIIDGRRVRVATMHSQKIGAAVRCIDDWHGDPIYGDMPVPVNPYAGVQELNICLRDPKASGAPDYYSLAKKPARIWNDLEQGTINDDAHFFMANLVRGGVFGDKS